MWVHALAGQRLGLVEGWRDLRDGSREPRPPIVTKPALVEVIAHTALDLMFFRRELAAFRPQPAVAVIVDDAALSKDEDNRWSADASELFNTLVQRQLHFDVLPASVLDAADQLHEYRAVLIAAGGDQAEDLAERVRRMASSEARVLTAPQAGTPADLAAHLAALPEPEVARDLQDPGNFVVYDLQGRIARGCAVFTGATPDGERCVAVANLRRHRQVVALACPLEPDPPAFRDVISGETVAPETAQFVLDGYQVRLLIPGGAE
jgi:hypothetical protein